MLLLIMLFLNYFMIDSLLRMLLLFMRVVDMFFLIMDGLIFCLLDIVLFFKYFMYNFRGKEIFYFMILC